MSAKDHKREDGARTKVATTGTVKQENVKIGGEWKFQKNPAYIKERQAVWEELYAAQEKKYAGKYFLALQKTRQN